MFGSLPRLIIIPCKQMRHSHGGHDGNPYIPLAEPRRASLVSHLVASSFAEPLHVLFSPIPYFYIFFDVFNFGAWAICIYLLNSFRSHPTNADAIDVGTSTRTPTRDLDLDAVLVLPILPSLRLLVPLLRSHHYALSGLPLTPYCNRIRLRLSGANPYRRRSVSASAETLWQRRARQMGLNRSSPKA
ncbi:hypothetical protein AG1IA_05849 [Rhizoctonia solani AG-1 IA]|uniref:Uncharacterized protein n=1 Tax=Thanatephorus cucumeris (strain AG1-IA) TaxID=983506 RepID=L8WQ35_THACA|nr:hypothetical protein AG1IA_05849 [Rhizoctonia solani AG-1 IA]